MPDFNSDFFKKVRADLNDALKSVGEKHGLTFDIGTISYLDDHFTAKIQGVKIGGKSVEARYYEEAADLLKLPPLGTEFTLKGEKYVTKGLNKTGTSVIITRTKDQKDFVCKTSLFSSPSFEKQSTVPAQETSGAETPLQNWIQRENIFAKPDQKYPTDSRDLKLWQLAKLKASIENALSPENLTCDGELRGQALKTKERQLSGALSEVSRLIEWINKERRSLSRAQTF
jgi:hypothetical protein